MKKMKNDVQYYSKEFYPVEIIQNAIQAYRKLAVISVSEAQEHYTCRFTDCVIDNERIICEFNNYLIELLNSSRTSVEA